MPYTNGVEYTDLGTSSLAEAAADPYRNPKLREQKQPHSTSPRASEQAQTQEPNQTKTAPVQDAASEARSAQIRDGAKSAFDNYLGNFSANVQATNKELVATGKNLMDSAYVFNEAWNAVQNGTVFQGSIPNQRAFVMNAALAFGDATAKAHGWQLVDEGVVGDVRHMTGFDKDTGTWNFVFKDKNGQYVTKSTTMDQVSSQLKNNGYYADTPAKDEGKSGSGKGGAPDNAGESGIASSKPRSEPGYGDISKQYNGFFDKTFDQEGNETGYALSQQGEQFMRDELSVATGKERRWLVSTLANKMAKEALDANAGAAEQGKDKTTYEQEYKRAVSALNEQYADPSAKSGEGPAPQAPVDALEAFAESVNVEKSGMKGAYDAASARRKEREDNARAAAEQNRRARSVYVNGQWVTQADIDDGKVQGKTTGVTKGVGDVSEEDKERARQMTWENAEKAGLHKKENTALSQDELVSGLDDLLSTYDKEDASADERAMGADYFIDEGDEKGGQLTEEEIAGLRDDGNGNLTTADGRRVRKEYFDDGTGWANASSRGGGQIASPRPGAPQEDGTVEYDRSGLSRTQSERNEEVFDRVMRMDPATRRKLAEETDGNGNLTERAKAVRNAILDHVDKENLRDSERAVKQKGAVQNGDGSFSRTYRNSRGGLVMEETFGSDRLTEQGREARLNALLDAELDENYNADMRGDAERMSTTELTERGKAAAAAAKAAEPDEILRSEGWATQADADENERRQQQLAAGPRGAAADAERDEAYRMTASERQRREWANRDRSKERTAPSEPPPSAGEPGSAEPENKPSDNRPAPLPDDPAERRNAVKKDEHYSDVVLAENGDGTYQLTDKAIALLRENGLSPKNLSVEDVQRWIHEGDEYIINENPRAKDRARFAETSKRENVEEKVKRGRREMTDRYLNRMGEKSVAGLTDKDIEKMFADDVEYVKQKREQARKNIDSKRRSSGR